MKVTFKRLAIFALAMLSLSAGAKVTNGKVYGDWKGLCVDTQCAVEQFATENNNRIGRMLMRKDPEAKKIVVFFSVPDGVALLAGATVSIDGVEMGTAPYTFCISGHCEVLPMVTDDDVLSKLKAGSKLKVGITSITGEKKDITFSLKGVTAAINDL